MGQRVFVFCLGFAGAVVVLYGLYDFVHQLDLIQ
jgi:hypothetical protein